MIGKLAKPGAFLICITVSACGPALDIRDAVEGRLGPYTPYGKYERDLWGQTRFVPYKSSPQQKTQDNNLQPQTEGDVAK